MLVLVLRMTFTCERRLLECFVRRRPIKRRESCPSLSFLTHFQDQDVLAIKSLRRLIRESRLTALHRNQADERQEK